MFVLDSSALLALLLDEPGHERVAAVLASDSRACTVNLSEVVSVLVGGGMPAPVATSIIRQLPVEAVDFDMDLAFAAGAMAASTKPFGLSFGDRACLATGKRQGRTVVTSDQAWGRLPAELGFNIEVIRPASARTAAPR